MRAGELDGLTAVVTGASRGIGRAVARGLARAGAEVVCSSRGGPELREVADRCGGAPVAADLATREGIDLLAREVRSRADGGAPHVLVNDAGTFELAPAHALSPETVDRHLTLNVRAPLLLTRSFLPAMLDRGSGHLLHLGSAAGRRALPGNGAYSASKYALRGFHEVLRVELEGTGVCSTLLEPSAVDTEIWDSLEPRLGEDLPARSEMLSPDQVAGAALSAVQMGPYGEGGSPGEISLSAG